MKGEGRMLVARYQTVSQFEPPESDAECGPFAVALNKYAGKDAPGGSPEDVDVLADRLWDTHEHSDGGIMVPALLKMLDDTGLHYQKIGSVEGNDHVENLTHETALHWLRQGYPLICTVNEKEVIDLDLGGSPYAWLQREPWKSNPPNHIFTLAGIADDGNVLVSDPANANAFPRRYQLDRLNFITLVAVILPWMPQTLGEASPIDLTDPIVAGYFTQTPDGQWKCKQTGFIVRKGILKFYRFFGHNAYCGLTYLGLPKNTEEPISGQSGAFKQLFERAVVAYDPTHQVDHPPGAKEAYLMHLPN
jgi:hypothetical protein